jgi:type IV secretion system protein VirD4
VLGPTQSGKTTGLAVPSILEWEGPCIATSVKNDLAQDTLGWRERQGSVWVYDPTATTGLEMSTWSPLDGAREWSGAKKIASWLTSASKSGGKGLSDGDFWYSAAGKLLAPHLFAAAANGYTMADVVRWIDTQEEFEVRSLLQATGVEEAITAAEASWQREDRAKSSIYTTAEVVIEAYSEPTILESAKTSEIRTSKFFDGGHHTLYVCAPSHEQDRLRPVFSTLLKQFIRAAYDFGKRLDPPLLIVLDEAANIAPLDDLDSIASTCSGLGIQLLTVWQDLSQINARYGDRANTVVNNHRAKIVLSGISDPTTLDYVSRLVGSEEIRSESSTIDGSGSKSRTISTQDKNLAPSDVVRRIKQNEGLLVYGALLPARLKLRPWYKSKRLTAMVKNDIPEDHRPELQAQNTAGDPANSPAYDDYQKTSPIG